MVSEGVYGSQTRGNVYRAGGASTANIGKSGTKISVGIGFRRERSGLLRGLSSAPGVSGDALFVLSIVVHSVRSVVAEDRRKTNGKTRV